MIPIQPLQQSFLAFAVALIAAALVAGPAYRMLIALNSRQTVYDLAPQSHQTKQGTPTMGGIIIVFGFLVSALVVSHHYPLALWTLAFGFIGFADDFIVPRVMKGKRGLGWKQKIIAQVFLAVIAAYEFGLPTTPTAVALTAFLVLFFCNAYNFADGLDALAGSLGLLLCLGLSLLAVISGQYVLVVWCAALAGAYIPFMFLNAPPAKVFMGDVGSLPLGAFFGVVVARLLLGTRDGTASWQASMLLPVVLLSLVMIAELVPVPMQVGYFKLTKKRLFPMTPIHHSFEVKGWPESRVVWSFVLAQLTLVVVAVGLASVTVKNPEPIQLSVMADSVHGGVAR